jgi:pimeloyl-ACP methyl ester carboxylesterase
MFINFRAVMCIGLCACLWLSLGACSGAGAKLDSMKSGATAILQYTPVAMPEPVQAAEGMADLGEVQIKYWDTGGNGEAVVLLHPATSNALGWGYQQPVLAKAGYRVISYSRRSHAGSSVGPLDNRGIASEDLRRVLDVLKVDRFHALGVAAGGIYAIDFALSHPKRVLSLAIAGSIIAIGDDAYMGRSSALRPRGFEAMPPEFRELGPNYRAGDPQGVQRWKLIESANTPAPVGGAAARQGTLNAITLASLKALTMPILLTTGDADLYTPPAMLHELASSLQSPQVAVFHGAGHSVHWEQPTAFNTLVLDFLRANRPPNP